MNMTKLALVTIIGAASGMAFAGTAKTTGAQQTKVAAKKSAKKAVKKGEEQVQNIQVKQDKAALQQAPQKTADAAKAVNNAAKTSH